MDGIDFIEQAGNNPAPARKGSKKAQQFVSPTERLAAETVQGATKGASTRKGLPPGWKRHTLVVHDEWLALVEEIANEYDITAMDAWRYLLSLGVRDHLAGERPELVRRPRALNKLARYGVKRYDDPE